MSYLSPSQAVRMSRKPVRRKPGAYQYNTVPMDYVMSPTLSPSQAVRMSRKPVRRKPGWYQYNTVHMDYVMSIPPHEVRMDGKPVRRNQGVFIYEYNKVCEEFAPLDHSCSRRPARVI